MQSANSVTNADKAVDPGVEDNNDCDTELYSKQPKEFENEIEWKEWLKQSFWCYGPAYGPLTDHYGSGRLNGASACDPLVAHVISRLLKRQFFAQYCFSFFLSFRFLYTRLTIH
jgi:hypothetical protein